MSKHTPGPWKVIRDGNDLSVRSANSRDTGKITHLDIAENIGGLRPGPDFTDRSEAKANARLIAAAPDLLDALTKVTSFVVTDVAESCNGNKCREPWCAGCFGEEVAEQTVREAREALDAARAAIAKVTGK